MQDTLGIMTSQRVLTSWCVLTPTLEDEVLAVALEKAPGPLESEPAPELLAPPAEDREGVTTH